MIGRRPAARQCLLASGVLSLLVAVLVAACGSATTGKIVAPRSSRLARWLAFAHLGRPLDVVAGEDGRRIATAAGGSSDRAAPIAAGL